jgi:ribosomal protein L12E/L44/L45/RPP1/RPP2
MAVSVTPRWWKDHQPEDCDPKDLTKALVAYERDPGPKTLAAVEKAAHAVLDGLDKKKHKESLREMKQFLEACAAEREALAEAARRAEEEAGEEEDEAEEPDLLSRDTLVKGLKLALKQPIFFAAAEGDDGLRMIVHKSRAASSLASRLKKAIGASVVACGVAQPDPARAKRLQLTLEGKSLPGLAKKAKALLKDLQPLPFTACAVLGEEGLETADDDEATPGPVVASAAPRTMARFFGA